MLGKVMWWALVVGVEEVLDELAGVADDGEQRDTGEEAEEGGALGGDLPGAWGGYSVRRSGRLVEWPWSSPLRADGTVGDLPGDGSEQAEADDEAEGERRGGWPRRRWRGGGEGWTWWSLLGKRDAHEKTCGMRLIRFLRGGVWAREGLATTTTSGHEVQGRELAEDRHVGIQCTPAWAGTAQIVTRSCRAAALALPRRRIGFLVNLFGGGALFGEGCPGFFEEEEVVVPGAQGLLGVLESGGQGGGSLRGGGPGLGDVTGGLAGFADGVE